MARPETIPRVSPMTDCDSGHAAKIVRFTRPCLILPAWLLLGARGAFGQDTESVVTPAAAEARLPRRALGNVLAANLPAWTGGAVVLDKQRLQLLAGDPRIRGEDAAALAALLHR